MSNRARARQWILSGGCLAGSALLAVACAEAPEEELVETSSSVMATSVTEVEGNPTCADLAPEGVVWEEIKFDASEVFAGSSKTSDDDYITVTIDAITGDIATFDWSATEGIDAVFAKGGPGGNLYLYDPEALTDDGLTAYRGGNNYGISHVSFCYDIEFARISIEPDAVNEVGDPHTFTVLVEQRVGLSGDWEPVDAGTQVLVELTDAHGAVSDLDTTATTCDVDTDGDSIADHDGAGTDADGECVVVFTSASAGTVTAHAESTPSVNGSSIFVQTGAGEYDADGIKRFVDASITIGDDATNGIGESHTFTVDALVDDGTGAGAVAVPDGTQVLVELTSAGGAMAVVESATCDVDTDGDSIADHDGAGTTGGQCTVTFYSDTAGTVTGHASFELDVDGVLLVRETDGVAPNSDDAVKTYVDGSITWEKVDDSTPPVRLAGATFEVCRTHDWNSTTMMMDLLGAPVCAIVEDCVAAPCDDSDTFNDSDAQPGVFLLADLPLGRYTIEEESAPAGYVKSDVVETVDVSDATQVVLDDFVNPPEEMEELSGCTPGFWKNHPEAWVGYSPYATFSSVFGVDLTPYGLSNSLTLMQALGTGGGGANKLLRHATAALLNLSSGFGYPGAPSIAALISAVQTAFATGVFEPLATNLDLANNYGCLVD